MEERIDAAIQGVEEPGSELTPVRQRYAGYLGWLEQPAVLSLRFEDLILERPAALRPPAGLPGKARRKLETPRPQAVAVLPPRSRRRNRAHFAKASRATGKSISPRPILPYLKKTPAICSSAWAMNQPGLVRRMAPVYPGIETICCNLCGADDTELLFKLPVIPYHQGIFNRDEWDIVRCRRCGLVYENPRSDAQARQYVYSFENEGDRRFVDDWFLDNADLNRATWQQVLKVLAKYKPAGTLLDVGCGAGTFLEEARRTGYWVKGQEVAPYFLRYCQETLGLEMYTGELEVLNLPAGSLDVVTAFDVIEHHPDPRRLLDEFRRLVKPDGVVVISTHDIGNWFARRYGVHWRYLGAIAHLTYFTRQTLSRMLDQAGFKVVYMGGGHTLDTSPVASR